MGTRSTWHGQLLFTAAYEAARGSGTCLVSVYALGPLALLKRRPGWLSGGSVTISIHVNRST